MQRETSVGYLQRCAWALAILAGLISFFYLFENWRGQRAWKKFSREMAMRGEKLDWQAYVPKPVPDEQNFLTTPVLEAIAYKGQTDPAIWGKFQDNPLARYSFDCSLWRDGKPLDLRGCQAFLQGALTSDPAPSP